MPTFGFVLTLAPSAETSTLAALAREAGITLGELQGRRLPVVLELAPPQHAEPRIEAWLALPGVLHVDYAFAAFDDLVSPESEKEEPA